MAPTGGDLLLQCLCAQGVRAVFGMPGTQNIALYDAFHRCGPGLRHYLIRNEQGATLLANGFARASGEVAAAFTVPGPGATNAATGVVDAWTDCVPLLLVVGGYDRPMAARDRAKMFHGMPQEEVFRPITRYFGRPASASDIPQVIDEAFQAMFAGRPGPAVIELPPDVAAEPAPAAAPLPRGARLTDALPCAPEIAAAARQIGRMKRPVVLVGGDCIASDACPEVLQLAELLHAPVMHGRLGKGVVADEHRLAAGFLRSRRNARLLEQADGAVAVGVRFTQIDTSNWQLRLPGNLVQLDRDRRELGREFAISAGVAGGLQPALRQLQAELQQNPPGIDAAWSTIVDAAQQERQSLPPVPVLSQIRQVLPPNGLISVDVTALGYSCFDRYPVAGPRRLMYPCHSVTLGFGFPAALGAKLAQPDRPVVSLSGDAGFLMTCYELATAVDYEVGVVAVVVKDNCLTAIAGSQQQAFSGRTIDVAMRSPDFKRLAESFGAHGETTNRPEELPELIQAGLARRGPTVIEIRLENQTDNLVRWIPWLNDE